jgi:hypothetical protein
MVGDTITYATIDLGNWYNVSSIDALAHGTKPFGVSYYAVESPYDSYGIALSPVRTLSSNRYYSTPDKFRVSRAMRYLRLRFIFSARKKKSATLNLTVIGEEISLVSANTLIAKSDDLEADEDSTVAKLGLTLDDGMGLRIYHMHFLLTRSLSLSLPSAPS